MLPKQPPVHIFNTGTLEGGDDVKLAEYYGSYGFNAFYMKTGFLLGGYDYESEKNDPDNPLDRFAWSQRGDGYHETTRYGELEEEDRRNSLGTVMRNWVRPGVVALLWLFSLFMLILKRDLFLNAAPWSNGIPAHI